MPSAPSSNHTPPLGSQFSLRGSARGSVDATPASPEGRARSHSVDLGRSPPFSPNLTSQPVSPADPLHPRPSVVATSPFIRSVDPNSTDDPMDLGRALAAIAQLESSCGDLISDPQLGSSPTDLRSELKRLQSGLHSVHSALQVARQQQALHSDGLRNHLTKTLRRQRHRANNEEQATVADWLANSAFSWAELENHSSSSSSTAENATRLSSLQQQTAARTPSGSLSSVALADATKLRRMPPAAQNLLNSSSAAAAAGQMPLQYHLQQAPPFSPQFSHTSSSGGNLPKFPAADRAFLEGTSSTAVNAPSLQDWGTDGPPSPASSILSTSSSQPAWLNSSASVVGAQPFSSTSHHRYPTSASSVRLSRGSNLFPQDPHSRLPPATSSSLLTGASLGERGTADSASVSSQTGPAPPSSVVAVAGSTSGGAQTPSGTPSIPPTQRPPVHSVSSPRVVSSSASATGSPGMGTSVRQAISSQRLHPCAGATEHTAPDNRNSLSSSVSSTTGGLVRMNSTFSGLQPPRDGATSYGSASTVRGRTQSHAGFDEDLDGNSRGSSLGGLSLEQGLRGSTEPDAGGTRRPLFASGLGGRRSGTMTPIVPEEETFSQPGGGGRDGSVTDGESSILGSSRFHLSGSSSVMVEPSVVPETLDDDSDRGAVAAAGAGATDCDSTGNPEPMAESSSRTRRQRGPNEADPEHEDEDKIRSEHHLHRQRRRRHSTRSFSPALDKAVKAVQVQAPRRTHRGLVQPREPTRNRSPAALVDLAMHSGSALRLANSLLGGDFGILEALSSADSWEFDIFYFAEIAGRYPLTLLTKYVFDKLNLFEIANLDAEKFCTFMTQLEEAYLDNPYHSHLHAADVVQNLFCFVHATDPASFVRGMMTHEDHLDQSLHSHHHHHAFPRDGRSGGVTQSATLPSRVRSNRAMTMDVPRPTFCRTRHGIPFGLPQSPITNRKMHEMLEAAADAQVSQSQERNLADCITALDTISAFVAAAAHDVAHPGTTNQYQIASGSNLALLYNDTSVLEHFHLATAWKILRRPECDFLADFEAEQRAESRSTIIEMVLATDMKRHVEVLSDVKSTLEQKKAKGGWFDSKSRVERLRILKAALHCADVANPTKPLRLYLNWADRIMEEWFTQGDLERSQDLPVSPMMDRNKPLIEVGQLGFIDFFITPLFHTWVEIVPASRPVLDYLHANREYWENLNKSKALLKKVMGAVKPAASGDAKGDEGEDPPTDNQDGDQTTPPTDPPSTERSSNPNQGASDGTSEPVSPNRSLSPPAEPQSSEGKQAAPPLSRITSSGPKDHHFRIPSSSSNPDESGNGLAPRPRSTQPQQQQQPSKNPLRRHRSDLSVDLSTLRANFSNPSSPSPRRSKNFPVLHEEEME